MRKKEPKLRSKIKFKFNLATITPLEISGGGSSSNSSGIFIYLFIENVKERRMVYRCIYIINYEWDLFYDVEQLI